MGGKKERSKNKVAFLVPPCRIPEAAEEAAEAAAEEEELLLGCI